MPSTHLPILPGPPHADLKRRILDEFMQNPLQDDDIQGLSLRVDVDREELAEALDGLCNDCLLKSAGRHGYMLDPEGLDFNRSEPVEAVQAPAQLNALGPALGLAHFQEELVEKIREELVNPLVLVQQFLENPQTAGLGAARAAMEQINWFLEDYMLSGKAAPAANQIDTGLAE